MNAEQVPEAAHILWSHWQSGACIPALPDHCRPHTREESYTVQAEVRNRSGLRLLGWKIAATGTAGQQHLGVDGPLAGSLLAGLDYPGGATIPFGSNHLRVAEPEFAFRSACDLPARGRHFTVDETLSAVGSLHPAIEIPDSRYEEFARAGAPQLIPDNACAHYVVLGTACPEEWRDLAWPRTPSVSQREATVRVKVRAQTSSGIPTWRWPGWCRRLMGWALR